VGGGVTSYLQRFLVPLGEKLQAHVLIQWGAQIHQALRASFLGGIHAGFRSRFCSGFRPLAIGFRGGIRGQRSNPGNDGGSGQSR
jgi:hypothetical protein